MVEIVPCVATVRTRSLSCPNYHLVNFRNNSSVIIDAARLFSASLSFMSVSICCIFYTKVTHLKCHIYMNMYKCANKYMNFYIHIKKNINKSSTQTHTDTRTQKATLYEKCANRRYIPSSLKLIMVLCCFKHFPNILNHIFE